METIFISEKSQLSDILTLARTILPHDPTPSLEDIAAQPDVDYLGAPQPAPQKPSTDLRVIVHGDDALVNEVVSFLMRRDILWVHIAYIPTDPLSPIAHLWGLSDWEESELHSIYKEENLRIRPTALIRDDSGRVLLGLATITAWDDNEITAEVIVDSQRLFLNERPTGFFAKLRSRHIMGAKIVPTLDEPGLAAIGISPHMTASNVLTGRALQAGGYDLKIIIDSRQRKRSCDKVTFYRHLRDLQIVLPEK